jgi:Fe-S-cluster containining protein
MKIKNIIANKATSPVEHLIDQFPFRYEADGGCEKYDRQTRKCTVYESRPEICRVDEVFKYMDLPRNVFYAMTERVCHLLQQEEASRTSQQ